MINYLYAFICSIIFYVLIQYYVNNYCSDDNKYLLNSGNNKIILFIGILLLFEGGLYIFTSNILKTFNTSSASSIVGGSSASSISGGSSASNIYASNSSNTSNSSNISSDYILSNKILLEDFENTFINSIKNQEVDVGVVPF